MLISDNSRVRKNYFLNTVQIGKTKHADLMDIPYIKYQGPVVQSIVILTSSLRGQLVEKMTEAFALQKQKLLTFFSTKILENFRY